MPFDDFFADLKVDLKAGDELSDDNEEESSITFNTVLSYSTSSTLAARSFLDASSGSSASSSSSSLSSDSLIELIPRF